MKTLLNFGIFFLISISVTAQTKERIELQGKIIATGGEDIEKINIYNLQTKTGDFSNQNGVFEIKAGINDSLVVSGIQFEPVTIIVDAKILESSKIDIYITELINRLPEVVLKDHNLTGNLNEDIANLNIVKDLPFHINFNFSKDTRFAADINDTKKAVPNTAMPALPAGGLDIIGIVALGLDLLNIDLSKPKEKDPVITRKLTGNVIVDVKAIFDNKFFKEYLYIDEAFIDEFIYFAADNGLMAYLESEKNQLDIIEFLKAQSEKYLEIKSN